jgi:hypothetical protein
MKNIFQKFLGALVLVTVSIVIAQIEMGTGMALAFAMPIGFSNLTWPSGSENMGGYKNRLLFIPASAVTVVPELPTEPVASDDLVTAAGAFTFKEAGDKPIFIYATKNTVSYNSENQGEVDGQSFLQTLEWMHPGSSAEAGAFARKVNNTPGYLIYEDAKGIQYMVGQSGMPCSIKPAFAGGASPTDRKGTTFTAEADSFCPYIILGTPIDMDEIENPVVAP